VPHRPGSGPMSATINPSAGSIRRRRRTSIRPTAAASIPRSIWRAMPA
jgi:hypothetical protein